MAGPAEADEITSPVVWRRWLSSELVRLRNKAKLTQRDAAHALRCSVGKLSYLESGDRAYSPDELEVLLPLYKVPKNRWPEYVQAAEAADKDGWWDAWADEDLPNDTLRYIGLEDGASRRRAYNTSIVDGLLQTPAYAAAVLERSTVHVAPERIERIAALRTARQAVLTRQTRPLDLHVVIDEAAIRRQVGGRSALRQQLEHLADRADEANVTLQILPFEAGAPMAIYGPFSILEFPWPDDPGVVHAEGFLESNFLEARSDIYWYSQAFTQLRELALDPDRSVGLIRHIQEQT